MHVCVYNAQAGFIDYLQRCRALTFILLLDPTPIHRANEVASVDFSSVLHCC